MSGRTPLLPCSNDNNDLVNETNISQKMKEGDSLIKVFTGSEFSVFLLKAKLEEIGILAIVRNDFNGAFLGTIPPAVDLLINESDLEKAEPIIREFIQNDEG
jgi:hypothetical protein